MDGIAQRRVHLRQALFQRFDAIRQVGQLGLEGRGRLRLSLAQQLPDAPTVGVAACAQVLQFDENLAPLIVQRQRPVHGCVKRLQVLHGLLDHFQVVTNESDV